MPQYAIISGNRYWSGPDLDQKMRSLFLQMPRTPDGRWDAVIVHGGYGGVDKTADRIARELGLPVLVIKANFRRYGKAAVSMANKEILDLGAGAVYAFHRNLQSSTGTLDMVQQAQQRNIPAFLIT